MKMKYLIMSLLITGFLFSSAWSAESRKNGKAIEPNNSNIRQQERRMDINNMDVPLLNDGSIGNGATAWYPRGQTDASFLFEGGIATTGIVGGETRASWMAKASRIEEFQEGIWGMDPNDSKARFYVVDGVTPDADDNGVDDVVEWADAVALGADFQDNNGDGLYDPSVDYPDLIGDRTLWTVYNDGVAIQNRALLSQPIGIEVQQQAWAFNRSDALGDVLFLRYRFNNQAGADIDSLIFSIWEDPDLGDAGDDLIGCDTTFDVASGTVKSLGYIYNFQDDADYGANPPAFGVDFFQGPVVDASASDTAFLFRGPFFGIDTLPGQKNLGMTAFTFYSQSLGDPDNVTEARNLQVGGFNADGNEEPIDPRLFGNGGTINDNNRFMFSGDPVAGTGWLDNTPADKRFMVNCGPFQLPQGAIQDVVVGYVVSQDDGPLSSLAKMRETDVIAQIAYDANFFVAGPPPPPVVDVRTFDKRIELIVNLETNGTFRYRASDKLLNEQVFEGIKIYQFSSNFTSETVSGRNNRQVLETFDLDNAYKDIYVREVPPAQGGMLELLAGKNNLPLDGFADEGSAIIRYVIDKDVFDNGNPLVNGQEYYFTVSAFSINIPFLKTDTLGFEFGRGEWIANGLGDYLENSLGTNFITVKPQSNELQPFPETTAADYIGPRSNHDGAVFVDVTDFNAVGDDAYEVSFFDNGNLWTLTNLSSGQAALDSMTYQAATSDEWNFPIVDGLSIKVLNVPDQVDTATVTSETSDVWLQGNTESTLPKPTAVFNDGIDLVHHSNVAGGFTKDRYFPVELRADADSIGRGFWFLTNLTGAFRGMHGIPLTAWDVSNPSSPRQVNVAYSANFVSGGNVDFKTAGANRFIVLDSDYTPDGSAYPSGRDSAFIADSYLLVHLGDVDPANDSTLARGPITISVTPKFPNSDVDKYSFAASDLNTELDLNAQQELLETMKVVPNPYLAYSSYETSYDTPVLRFTHVAAQATIRIFNVAGQLVRTIDKNDTENEARWDLRNSAGLKVASGMYIAHITVPGVGEKVLKFAVVQREERIDRF